MAVADYDGKWGYLSKEHERKDDEIQEILDKYGAGEPPKYLSYAIIGTYGIGKTQLLYQIHKCAIERNIIPLYFLAEDLFREVITENRTWTPGNVYSLIENKISRIRDYLSNRDVSEIYEILDRREKIRRDAPKVIEKVLEKFSGRDAENTKVLLLIDELEGQYGNLQKTVYTMDRSPLREWFESTTHVKFVAFAPAGIYGLGGADRDRVKRIVIPPADIKYIRENLIKDAGKSNACWWLSRGKARQIFKAADVLRKLDDKDIQDAANASRIIKGEFDSIGQPPTEMPPAVTDKISPSKIPLLLKLAPITGERKRRYVIDAEKLQTGKLADRLVEAFGINKDNAILISEYFKKTVRTISNNDWTTYIDEGDLPELFCLALDHFLEYEHGNPELSQTLGDILGLYEKYKKESAAMYGIIGRLWKSKETERQSPFTIEKMREVFIFPTMNPIVKDYEPEEMKKKWERQGLPLWKWIEGNITVLFSLSARDFIAYSEMDEFLSLSLPDGKGVLCFLPYDEDLKKEEKKPLFKWLEENNKLKVIKLQHLLTDFTLSASGELTEIPGNLQEILREFKENKKDILLSRKAEIYGKALEDTIKDKFPKPETFYKGSIPDADTVWGRIQIGHRTIAVSGIALAFSSLKLEEKRLLADLRELFKGGGDIRYLISGREAPGRGGHTRLPDRLLPYHARGAGINNTEHIEKLKIYWRSEERNKLTELARTLPLYDFLKLHSDEDMSRLLEALWRIVRQDFEIKEMDVFIEKIKKDFIPTLSDCLELEQTASKFGLSGIDFEGYEQLVKSFSAFEKLLEIAKESTKTSSLVKSIVSILIESINDIDSDIRTLNNLSSNVNRALEDLSESAENLKKNFWEYRKAVKFCALKEGDIDKIIEEQIKMSGTPNLRAMEKEAKERKDYLNDVSTSLSRLEQKLGDLENLFTSIKGGD